MEMDDVARKELIAGVFDRTAPTYDRVGPRFFSHFGSRLVDVAALQVGDRVLDVACGRGAVLFEAAARVGPKGKVIGIDLSTVMVDQTSRDAARQQIRNAEVRQMDAESLKFSDAEFDAVLCGFALFFFPRVEQALSEFRRVLRPRGRLAVTTWGEADPRWSWEDEVRKAHAVPVRLRTKALDKRADLEGTIRTCGFRDVQVLEERVEFKYASEEEWWATQWSHGGRATLDRLDANALQRLKDASFDRMKLQRTSDGYPELFHVLYGVAVKMP
jgi:O-methyltransferase / aklanonic acid methyltransferase